MYSKRVFKVLTTLFALFVLTGCGEGNSNEKENANSSNSEKSKNSSSVNKSGSSVKGVLTSVNESDYFPKFDVKADGFTHIITRYYKSEAEQIDDINAFKNKGSYTENSASTTFYRLHPLSKNGAITGASAHQEMIREGYYETMMGLSGISGETIARDNALFEKIFGYKNGALKEVDISRYFFKNITAKLQQYAALLEKEGFKKSGAREWRKVDTDNNRMYTWNYDVIINEGAIKQQSITVNWNVWLTDNYCKI